MSCSKTILAVGEAVIAELSPIRKRYEEFVKDKSYLEECYRKSDDFANHLAQRTIDKCMKKIGFILK